MFSVLSKKLKQDFVILGNAFTRLCAMAVLVLAFGSGLSGSCGTIPASADETPGLLISTQDQPETSGSKVGTEFTVSRITYRITADPYGEYPGSVSIVSNNLKKKTTDLYIPDSVTFEDAEYVPRSIGDYAFALSKLETVILPDSIFEIGEGAFAVSEALSIVRIGPDTSVIAQNAFAYCNSIVSFTVDEDNPYYSFADGILYNRKKTKLVSAPAASGDIVIPSGVKKLSAYAFEGNTRITSVDLGSRITKIPGNAFFGCTGLEKVVIPASVTKISGNPFKYCPNLTDIDINRDNEKYVSRSGMITSLSGKTLYAFPGASGSITLESPLKYVNAYAFCGSGVTEVTVPKNIKSIKTGAFYDCGSLRKVVFTSRSTALTADCTAAENKIFGNIAAFPEFTVPYSKSAPGELEASIRQNSPSNAIIVNR